MGIIWAVVTPPPAILLNEFQIYCILLFKYVMAFQRYGKGTHWRAGGGGGGPRGGGLETRIILVGAGADVNAAAVASISAGII